MDCKKCSSDPAVQSLLNKAAQDGIVTVWDRFESQQPQCGFGLLGVCCRNCVQGPCRIDPFGNGSDTGICGASADVIVARNLLRSVVGGAASHVDHAHEAVEALFEASEGSECYTIKDEKKLMSVASKLNIETSGKTINQIGNEIANIASGNLKNKKEKSFQWLLATAPNERIETWEKLSILPQNPEREICKAIHQTTMGVDADPINLILSTVKMGLVDGYGGLHMATDIQDILFGTPQPVVSEANLGVLREENINIIVHGHVPLLSEKVVEWARKLKYEAEQIGATNIQVSGICCSGNEVLMRQGVPIASNFLAQELAITTGVVDAVVVDVQCIMPSLPMVADCYHTKIITTMPISKLPGVEHVNFSIHNADNAGKEIVMKAIDAFKKRNPDKIKIPPYKSDVIAGFSVEAIVLALSKLDSKNPLKPLVDNIINGNILGAVGVVGCNNVKVVHDSSHIALVKELIKNNVLVVATGCAAHALGKAGLLNSQATLEYAGSKLASVLSVIGNANGLNAPLPPVLHMGSCVDNSRIGDLLSSLASYLNVGIKDLPVAASAPEYQHEKALAIGTWAVSLGLFTHLGVVPPVLGSKLVTSTLTSETVENLLGGKFYVECDPIKAAQEIIEHIKMKRSKLGI